MTKFCPWIENLNMSLHQTWHPSSLIDVKLMLHKIIIIIIIIFLFLFEKENNGL
jgi:hypothetical protein